MKFSRVWIILRVVLLLALLAISIMVFFGVIPLLKSIKLTKGQVLAQSIITYSVMALFVLQIPVAFILRKRHREIRRLKEGLSAEHDSRFDEWWGQHEAANSQHSLDKDDLSPSPTSTTNMDEHV